MYSVGTCWCQRRGRRSSSSSWRYAQSEPDQVRPDQVRPDQVRPDQVRPDQVSPDQVRPDQVRPFQWTPDQGRPDQVRPDQVSPDQVRPDQVRPFQLLPSRRPAAQVDALNARPRTSTSPLTTLPLTDTCTEPRASSREPTPVDTAKVCFAPAGVGVSLALARSSSPLPCSAAVAAGIGFAVPIGSAFTSSGVIPGRCWISSSAAPETTAAACEVPLPRKRRSPIRAAGYLVSSKDPGVRMLTTWSPGATRSGLRVPSPSLENSETTS